MANFSQAFWSSDYAGGLGVLFGKLQQGVQENSQILTIARMRADAEDVYGQAVADIGPATDRIPEGFSKDDGASVRKAYEGVRVEMNEAAAKHRKIAQNIRELVVYPFGRWCDQHAARVQSSQDELQGRVKAHDRQAEAVKKLRSAYFNKCRLVEDLEEEDKLAFKEPQSSTSSPKQQTPTPTVKIQEPEEEDDPEPVEIGDETYQPEQLKKILTHLLETIKMGDTKVPILGTYHNVSTGADITEYIQKNLNGTSVSYAERVGQDLIGNGFLRLVGNVGSTFMNSSRSNYQWRPKAWEYAGISEPKKNLARTGTMMSADGFDRFDSPLVGQAREYLAGWNPLNNPHPNETPSEKLRREARESDERYKAGVKKQDLLRCQLEEAMFEHLKFMERCELDRLKAIKSVILDFSGALSNVIPSLQSTVDKMMLFQETVQPLGDLRYMLENYRTGPFLPKVIIYENYYNSVDEQTFGVDVEARARADKKRVPGIITAILTFLDNKYPLLDGDIARRQVWTVDVPLAATHRLRAEVNNGMPISQEVLEKYEVPIVASLLKVYLLELPDSLVSSSLYEVIKAIYSNTDNSTTSSTRISILQNTLGQLRLTNIATLDAIATHFARLIDLTSADEEYAQLLTRTLAPCVLRPRTESALSFEEKYSLRFLRDLLDHKSAIFGELKRSIAAGKHHQTSLGPSASVYRANSTLAHNGNTPEAAPASIQEDPSTPRLRAISTDESNRRAHMEERNRAIAQNNRSRNASPAQGVRRDSGDRHSLLLEQRHRRDSSRGPSETRFPVHVSSGSISNLTSRTAAVTSPSTPGHKGTGSLEVPITPPLGSATNFPPQSGLAQSATNAASDEVEQAEPGAGLAPSPPNESTTAAPATDGDADTTNGNVEKSNSLQRRVHARRAAAASGSQAHINRLSAYGGSHKRDSSGSVIPDNHHSTTQRGQQEERRGVELSDRPVDLD